MRPIKSIILATTALTFCAFASTAQAQETAEQKAVDEAPAAGDIVVTGTRITRDGYDAPTPTTIVTAEQLDAVNVTCRGALEQIVHLLHAGNRTAEIAMVRTYLARAADRERAIYGPLLSRPLF